MENIWRVEPLSKQCNKVRKYLGLNEMISFTGHIFHDSCLDDYLFDLFSKKLLYHVVNKISKKIDN